MAIQIRRGTDSGWESNNSNIVAGEPAIAVDTERFFVGTDDGEYMELVNIDTIAPAYDSSTSYNVGDYCVYQGKLYVCNSATTGSWTSADWNEISVKQALDDLATRSVPTSVREAIYTLLNNAAYVTIGLGDEIAIVESWAEEVTSLTLSASTLSLSGSTPQTLIPTVVPSSASVSWSSSDNSIATVVGGVVTGVSNGTCTITASAGSLTATCEVTVSGFATLESISAVYTQSGTVYDTDSLDNLKDDLVVTATYDDTSTATVPSADYTLSGSLEVGTSTITVTYQGKTDTFNVTVTATPLYHFEDATSTTANYRITTTKGGHIKVEILNDMTTVNAGYALNMYSRQIGDLGGSASVINNLPKKFTLPANKTIVSSATNITDTTGLTNNQVGIRIAMTESSLSNSGFSLKNNPAQATTTPSSNTDISTPFIYISTNHTTLYAGSVIEFDYSLTVDGTRYI